MALWIALSAKNNPPTPIITKKFTNISKAKKKVKIQNSLSNFYNISIRMFTSFKFLKFLGDGLLCFTILLPEFGTAYLNSAAYSGFNCHSSSCSSQNLVNFSKKKLSTTLWKTGTMSLLRFKTLQFLCVFLQRTMSAIT